MIVIAIAMALLTISDIVKFSGVSVFKKSTYWLLNSHLEEGHKIKESHVDRVIELFPNLEHWK